MEGNDFPISILKQIVEELKKEHQELSKSHLATIREIENKIREVEKDINTRISEVDRKWDFRHEKLDEKLGCLSDKIAFNNGRFVLIVSGAIAAMAALFTAIGKFLLQ